jgi:hypothetical protein
VSSIASLGIADKLATIGAVGLPDDTSRPADLRLVDDPNSRFYVPPSMRRLWGALLAPVIAVLLFAGLSDVARVIIGAIWAGPTVLYNGILTFKENGLLRRRLKAAHVLRQLPRAGSTLDEQVTRMLQTTCLELGAEGTGNDQLRLTLFVPSEGRLRQTARFAWDGSAETSETTFGFGEGLVGESYSSNTDIVVPDIQALSNLEVVLGLMRHKKQDIRSVLVKAITDDEDTCVAVLSIDSTTRDFFNPRLRSLSCIADLAADLEELLRATSRR